MLHRLCLRGRGRTLCAINSFRFLRERTWPSTITIATVTESYSAGVAVVWQMRQLLHVSTVSSELAQQSQSSQICALSCSSPQLPKPAGFTMPCFPYLGCEDDDRHPWLWTACS